MNNRILWLITARSGSKGVRDKNIKKLGVFPLMAYKIKAALAIDTTKNVWVSTDSEEYGEIAKSYGASVPFIRPANISTDTAKSVDVVLHAMEFAEENGYEYDFVGLLEPTTPFIKALDLLKAVNKLSNEEEAESIVAVRHTRPSTFYIQEEASYLTKIADNISKENVLRRQEEKKEITPSGGFYISKWNAFKENKNFYTNKTLSYVLPEVNSIEIDEPLDWIWAEFLLEKEVISASDIFEVKKT